MVIVKIRTTGCGNLMDVGMYVLNDIFFPLYCLLLL